ncbi:putative SLC26A/SulP transporter [Lupinus albus]|uniref:Putative SLC26A/SulP transporter n=1 Tax=Lupinus albus TaxID=3870 RepID=A0A6A4QJ15_LUPAL|nr:putative SLC26A/SulP transporter [Lupinus albus]
MFHQIIQDYSNEFYLFNNVLFQRNRNPNLQWALSIGPITTVIIGGFSSYLVKGQQHGIQIVGHLDKGINPLSMKDLNFESKYLPSILKAGFITSIWSLAEGITVGRNFAEVDNSSYVENKDMIAFGLMNLCGSFTSCYLTTGPFSKTAMNCNAGCKTAMSNMVQAFLMAFILQFLAPFFYYTPLFALSAITVSTMMGLINYTEAIHLYKVDKFDFIICMAAFLGVIFGALDIGLMLSVGFSVLRALSYVARPAICTLGMLPDLGIYRDVDQYNASTFPGVLIIQLGAPIFFANCTYIRERIMSYIRSEQESNGSIVEQIILDMSGVTSIDTTAIQGLLETNKIFEMNGMKMSIVNPRMEVLEKLIASRFVDKIGKNSFFLTLDDAVKASIYSLRESKTNDDEDAFRETSV